MSTAARFSVTKLPKLDGTVLWAVWLEDGMPFPPSAYGYAPCRKDGTKDAKEWLASHGVTDPVRDGDHAARWWSRRTGAPACENDAPVRVIPLGPLQRKSLAVLGLEAMPDDPRQLLMAYRARVIAVHPDHGGTDTEFVEVRNAYEFLLQRVG